MKRSTLIQIGKTAVVAAFLYLLAQRGLLSLDACREALENRREIGIACGLNAALLLLTAVRWRWLLLAQKIRLPFGEAARLVLVGNFFNLALPGGVTGDVVKALQLQKTGSAASASAAMASLLVDRVAGMSGLILLAAAALFACPGTAQFAALRMFVLACGAGVTLFFAFVAGLSENRDPVFRWLEQVGPRRPFLGAVARFYVAVRAYHRHPGILVASLVLSVFIHFLGGLACAHLAAALGQTLPLAPLLVAFSVGTIANLVPLAPAGVGTGHAAFLFLFSLIGSQRGADLYTLVAATAVLWAAVGGIVYALSPLRRKSELTTKNHPLVVGEEPVREFR